MRALMLAAGLLLVATTLAAQQGGVRAIDRFEQGDTLVLQLQLEGEPALQLSEPYYLADRVRFYLDVNGAQAAPDSASLAALQGGNLLALERRERAGGLALVMEFAWLAGYRVVQRDSALQLRVLAADQVENAAALPASDDVQTGPPGPFENSGARLRASVGSVALRLSGLPRWLLLLLPAGLLLLISQRRRTVPAAPPPLALPEAAGDRPVASPLDGEGGTIGGRLWAVRTLAASGASIADVVRRTGMPREAIRFLEGGDPAISAAVGSNFRPSPAAGLAGSRGGTR